MEHVIFSCAALSLVYTRGSQWAVHLRSRLYSELPQNATCLNLTERRFSGVCMVRQRGVFFIWKVTWWKWNGPVSCVWHFDPWHWSVLEDLWSISMPVRPYGHTDIFWQIHAHRNPRFPPPHETQSWDHTHISMWSHDGPECVQTGDNRSPRAMSLRSSWQDTRRQMLRAKGTLSSPVWNTCVQSDNDTRAQFAHSWREEMDPAGAVCFWVTPSVLTVCAVVDGVPPGTYLWQTPESCDMLGYLLNNIYIVLKGLPHTENTFHKLRLTIRAFSGYVAARHHYYIPIFQSKTSKLITSEPLAHYEAPWCPIGLIGTTGWRGCVGIREQKDPSLSSKRIYS